MDTKIEELGYDHSDAAYLFSSMLKVFHQGDTEHYREATGWGEVELYGLLFEGAVEAAKELFRLVDWNVGFDGVFAYEYLDEACEHLLPFKLFQHITELDTTYGSIQALVLRHIEDNEWPQSELAKALLLPAAAMPFDPEDKTLGFLELEDKYGVWGAHPYFGLTDWQYEIANNDTRSGYWTWVFNQIQNWEPEDTAV